MLPGGETEVTRVIIIYKAAWFIIKGLESEIFLKELDDMRQTEEKKLKETNVQT